MNEQQQIKAQQQRWNPEIDFDLRYYVAGPMTGYENYNYPYFAEVAAILRQTGLLIESPHENPWPEGHKKMSNSDLWKYMMEVTDAQLSKCQGIILLKGWPQSTGACIELSKAMTKNWPVYYYHDYQLISMNKVES